MGSNHVSLKLTIKDTDVPGRYRSRIVPAPVKGSDGEETEFDVSPETVKVWSDLNLDRFNIREHLSQIGTALFNAVFREGVRDRYKQWVAIAAERSAVLRICVSNSSTTLKDVPWEYMHHDAAPIQSQEQVIVRIFDGDPEERQAFLRPIERILIAVAKQGLPPNEVAAHVQSIQTILNGAPIQAEMHAPRKKNEERAPLIEYEVIEEVTGAELRAKLESKQFDALYLAGHGKFSEQHNGQLELDGGEYLDALNVAHWAKFGGVRFAYLNACSSAVTGRAAWSPGVAWQLLKTGNVDCVIGMQAPIGIRVAFDIAMKFFEYVKQGDDVEAALSRARMPGSQFNPSWGIPVLFTRFRSPAQWLKHETSVTTLKQSNADTRETDPSENTFVLKRKSEQTEQGDATEEPRSSTTRASQRDAAESRPSPKAGATEPQGKTEIASQPVEETSRLLPGVSGEETIRLRNQASGAPVKWLPYCVYCWEVARLHDAATEIPFSLVRLLADLRLMTLAECYVQLSVHPEDRLWLQLDLAAAYARCNDLGKSQELLHLAENEIRFAEPDERWCERIRAVTERLSVTGKHDRAKRMAQLCLANAEKIDNDYDRVKALFPTVSALVIADEPAIAVDVVLKEDDASSFGDLAGHLAVELTRKGQLDVLVGSLGRLRQSIYSYMAFDRMVEQLATEGYVAQAKAIAKASGRPNDLCAHLCVGLARRQDFDGCVAAVESIGVVDDDADTSDNGQPGFWSRLAAWFSPSEAQRFPSAFFAAGYRSAAIKEVLTHATRNLGHGKVIDVAKRLAAAMEFDRGPDATETLKRLVAWMVKRDAITEAKAMARSIRDLAAQVNDPKSSRQARLHAIQALNATTQSWEARDLAQSVLAEYASEKPDDAKKGETVSDSDTQDLQDQVRHELAIALARIGSTDDVGPVLESIVSIGTRAYTAACVAVALHERYDDRKREFVAKSLDLVAKESLPPKQQTAYLEAIAYEYGEGRLFAEAMSAAQKISESRDRDDVYDVLAFLFERDGQRKHALEAARSISDFTKKVERFTGLVRAALARKQFDDAREIAGASELSYMRSTLLGEVAESVLGANGSDRDRLIQGLLNDARGVSEIFFRFDALARIARALAASNDIALADQICSETIALTKTRAAPSFDAPSWLRIANALATVSKLDAAVAVIGNHLKKAPADVAEQLVRFLTIRVGVNASRTFIESQESNALRAELWAVLGSLAASRNDRAEALRCANRIEQEMQSEDPLDGIVAQVRIVRIHFMLGEASEADRRIQAAMARYEEQDHKTKDWTLGNLLARAGQPKLAERFRVTDSAWLGRRIKVERAEALLDANLPKLAAGIAVQVLDEPAEDDRHDDWESETSRRCVAVLAKAGNQGEALQKSRRINDPRHRTQALVEIAHIAELAGNRHEADQAAAIVAGILAELPEHESFSARAELAAYYQRVDRTPEAQAELAKALHNASDQGCAPLLEVIALGSAVLAAIDRGETLCKLIGLIEPSIPPVSG